MTTNITAAVCRTDSLMAAVGLFVLLIGFVFIASLIFISLVRRTRFLEAAGKELKLIRMELSKLSDEVGQIRQELKGGTEQNF